MTAIGVGGWQKNVLLFFRLPKRRAAIVVTPVIRTYKGNLRLLIIISEI